MCTHPGEAECMHACSRIPAARAGMQRRLCMHACAVSSISSLKTKILHVPGTQDQDEKDVDRWMKIQDSKQQVILVCFSMCTLAIQVFMHSITEFNLSILICISFLLSPRKLYYLPILLSTLYLVAFLLQ